MTTFTWRKPEETPDVAAGSENIFVVAVRRALNGKVYRFEATYLNQFLLSYEDTPCPSCPGEDCPGENGDGCPVTGWFRQEPHYEYDSYYRPLLSKGDELVGWGAFPEWVAS
jgi:hypothetical protein